VGAFDFFISVVDREKVFFVLAFLGYFAAGGEEEEEREEE